MKQIDYAAFRKMFQIAEVLCLIDNFFIPGEGGQGRGTCPLGCCSGSRVCSYDMVRSLWHCHNCDKGGNALDLWCMVRQCDLYAGAETLAPVLGLRLPYLPE